MRPPDSPDAPLVVAEVVDPPRSSAAARDGDRAYHVVMLTAAIVLLAAAALLEVRGRTQVALFGVVLPELCFWRQTLGWNCPGCGLTRSFVSLAHGDLAAAWRFHLVGPALFAVVLIQVPYRGLRLWRLGRSNVVGAAP